MVPTLTLALVISLSRMAKTIQARLKLFDAEVEEAEQDKNRMRSVMNDIEVRDRVW